jgi:hypothetical protein
MENPITRSPSEHSHCLTEKKLIFRSVKKERAAKRNKEMANGVTNGVRLAIFVFKV